MIPSGLARSEANKIRCIGANKQTDRAKDRQADGQTVLPEGRSVSKLGGGGGNFKFITNPINLVPESKLFICSDAGNQKSKFMLTGHPHWPLYYPPYPALPYHPCNCLLPFAKRNPNPFFLGGEIVNAAKQKLTLFATKQKQTNVNVHVFSCTTTAYPVDSSEWEVVHGKMLGIFSV